MIDLFLNTNSKTLSLDGYYFENGEYYSLPLEFVGNLRITNKQNTSIEYTGSYKHKIFAKVVFVDYTEHAQNILVVFEIDGKDIDNDSICFFKIYDSKIHKHTDFILGCYYMGIGKFVVTSNIYTEKSLFSIIKVRNIFNAKKEHHLGTKELNGNIIIKCKYHCFDILNNKINTNILKRHKLESFSLGAFKFYFLDLYKNSYPEFFVEIENQPYFLSNLLSLVGIDNVIKDVKNGIFKNGKLPITLSFENTLFRLYDISKSKIIDKNDDKISENILLQFVSSFDTQNITLTNLDELECFKVWLYETIEKYEKILNA